MVQVAPLILANDNFALKGGTAINLFLRDMPRLSVDLDLTFTDHEMPRAATLAAINEAIRSARDRLDARHFSTRVPQNQEGVEAKLFVAREKVQVKIEINHVIRGSVNPVQRMQLAQKARDALFADVELPLLSSSDIYGSKLVAALDRQHPRTFLTFRNCLPTKGSRRTFVGALSCIWRVTTGRYMKCCFRRSSTWQTSTSRAFAE